MQTELKRPYFLIWFIRSFPLLRFQGGAQRSFGAGGLNLALFVRLPSKACLQDEHCTGQGRAGSSTPLLPHTPALWAVQGEGGRCRLHPSSQALRQAMQPSLCFSRLQRPMPFSQEKLWPGSWWAAPSARRGCISTPTDWSPKVKAMGWHQQSGQHPVPDITGELSVAAPLMECVCMKWFSQTMLFSVHFCSKC